MNGKKFGFTLVELMVAVSISVLLIGIGVANLSKFYAKDKLNAAKNEVLSTVKMAKNYAVTTQSPAGYVTPLTAVAVILVNQQLSVVPVGVGGTLGIGSSYFTTRIAETEIRLGLNNLPTNINFSVPYGKLLNNNLTPLDSAYTKIISISSVEGVGETVVVTVSSLGVISGQ